MRELQRFMRRRARRHRGHSGTLGLVAGVLALFLAGAAITYVLPLFDDDMSPPPRSQVSREVAAGERLYSSEGCVFCHTQQVRPVSNDIGLGPATRSEDVGGGRRPHLGLVRVGPDLSCAGDRDDEVLSARYLRNPQSVRPGSSMPGFGHLTSGELTSLVAYLQSLSCGGS